MGVVRLIAIMGHGEYTLTQSFRGFGLSQHGVHIITYLVGGHAYCSVRFLAPSTLG